MRTIKFSRVYKGIDDTDISTNPFTSGYEDIITPWSRLGGM